MPVSQFRAGKDNPEGILGATLESWAIHDAVRKQGPALSLGELIVTDYGLVFIIFSKATVWGGTGSLFGLLVGGLTGALVGTGSLDEDELEKAKSKAYHASQAMKGKSVISKLADYDGFAIPKDDIKEIVPDCEKMLRIESSDGTFKFTLADDLFSVCESLRNWLAPGSRPSPIPRESALKILKSLETNENLFTGERISKRQIRNILKAYVKYMLKEEDILAILDTTVFRGGDVGLLMTTKGIGLRNRMEDARFYNYAELSPEDIAGSKGELVIKSYAISILGANWSNIKEVLLRLIALAEETSDSPIRDDGATESGIIIDVLTRHLKGVHGRCHIFPTIPAKKIQNAKTVYGGFLGCDDVILLLYDGTALGSGKAGFICTRDGIGIKHIMESAVFFKYMDVLPQDLVREGKKLTICGQKIDYGLDCFPIERLEEALRQIIWMKGCRR